MMMAGVLGPPDGPPPRLDPEMQRLYFDLISRVADPAAANGSPLVYQWRFTDADPWHLVDRQRLDPGRARRSAEPEPDDRDQLGRLDRLRQTGRQPAEDGAAAPHPPARLDPRAGAHAQGLPLEERRASAGTAELRRSAGAASAQGRSASSWAASESSVASSPGRPMIWTESGMPSAAKPAGHRHRRVAEVVPGDAVGIEAAHPEHRPQGAPPLPAAHRQRRPAHHRHHQDVEVVEERVDAAASAAAAARGARS